MSHIKKITRPRQKNKQTLPLRNKNNLRKQSNLLLRHKHRKIKIIQINNLKTLRHKLSHKHPKPSSQIIQKSTFKAIINQNLIYKN